MLNSPLMFLRDQAIAWFAISQCALVIQERSLQGCLSRHGILQYFADRISCLALCPRCKRALLICLRRQSLQQTVLCTHFQDPVSTGSGGLGLLRALRLLDCRMQSAFKKGSLCFSFLLLPTVMFFQVELGFFIGVVFLLL